MKDLYNFLNKQENQGVYVIKIFIAARCTYFTLPTLKAKRTTRDLEYERHYVKDRSVQLIKDKFPNQINVERLTKYLEGELKDDCIRECMSHFGVPISFDENKKILAKALSHHFNCL